MVADIDPKEEAETLRRDIVVLLSQNPHCWIANLLGQRLMDLYE